MLLRFTRPYPMLEADGQGATGAQGGTSSADTATGAQGATQTQNQDGASAGSGAGEQSNTQGDQQRQQAAQPATLEAALQVIARLDRDNADLRRENANRRVAAKGETPEQKLQREIDDTRKEAESARAELARERLQTHLISKASAAYVIYPDLFANYYAAQVKYNAAGEPENVNDLIAHARKHYPALFKVPSADAGATGASNGSEPEVFGPTRIGYAYEQSAKSKQGG